MPEGRDGCMAQFLVWGIFVPALIIASIGLWAALIAIIIAAIQ